MSSFAPASEGQQKVVQTQGPYFPNISKILYNPNAPPSELCFKHYNAKRVVLGKTLEEHLRFSVVYWHTWRGTGADPFGAPTINRPWDDGTDSIENALRRMDVNFEFLQKLGSPFWAFHDRDIAPEGVNLQETNRNIDIVVDHALELQKKTGIRLLWGTSNLFANPRYMCGAASNPDPHVFAYAASQVKKMLDVTLKLGGSNFVFWGGREGYNTLLNSDVKRELDHMAAFFKMAIAYGDKIGFKGVYLIEPKAKEPTTHQYDYDAQTVISFLKTYGLDKRMKLNIEPNHGQLAGHRMPHDVHFAAKLGFLGSVDCNTGSEDLGWDTDEFIMEVQNSTQLWLAILQQGGIAPGGMNFDCKVRRESVDLEDLFWGHVSAMDCLALGVINAAKIIEDGIIPTMVKNRYKGWDGEFGSKIEKGQASLEDCESYVFNNGEPKLKSGKEEKYKAIFNEYLVAKL